MVDYIDEDDNEVRRAMKLYREKKPLGILFFGGTTQNFLADYENLSLPTVLVTNSAKGLPFEGLSSVTTDDMAAAETICDLLVRNGHREIAVIGGDLESSEISRNRLSGCQAALSGTGARMACYRTARYSVEGGYQAMEKILANRESITAVFAMADVMAVGAMRCIHDHGLRVPEDISVVGFDGIELGSYLTPKLTTIRQDREKIAARSVEILLQCIGEETSGVHELVPFRIISGESTRRI